MNTFRRFIGAVLLASVIAGPARALTPEQVFEKVSPSVWAVRALDSAERPIGYGSGVVIGPGRMITNCHVLVKARSVQVKREDRSHVAKLEHADVGRDLCTLTIASFDAPPVAIGGLAELKVGQRVYAIGNPETLALTLSEGLVSGLRSEVPDLPPIQTSAAISPGSSGGGLFDTEGRLVGITTLSVIGRARLSQNLNFALPADWIAQVPERAKAALEARKAATVATTTALPTPAPAPKVSPPLAAASRAASPTLPQPGSSYRYAWTDQQYSRRRQEFQVRVAGVDDWIVMESFSVNGGRPARYENWAQSLAFASRLLAESQTLVEFAPYLQQQGLAGLPSLARPSGYPESGGSTWRISARPGGMEAVSVPAGTYNALRVEVQGERDVSISNLGHGITQAIPQRFEYTAWYVPELKRYVKSRNRTWNVQRQQIGDEQVELLEYRPN